MADQNSEMLNKRIEETLGNLETLKGEERAQAVKELDTLYKLRIDETKNEVEAKRHLNIRIRCSRRRPIFTKRESLLL